MMRKLQKKKRKNSMKRLLHLSGIVAFAMVMVVGCVEDQPADALSLRNEYLGDWTANDREGWNAPAFYDITITAGSQDDQIYIQGLYNHPNVKLEAYINEFEVEIPPQMSDSISFAGSGKANVDFDQITFDYTANDGSGSDAVKTVCTRK